VCRRSLANLTRLWDLGRTVRADKVAVAASELSVLTLTKAGLQAAAAPVENYHEHAVVIGWPHGEKHERMSIAAKLVYDATLIHPVS